MKFEKCCYIKEHKMFSCKLNILCPLLVSQFREEFEKDPVKINYYRSKYGFCLCFNNSAENRITNWQVLYIAVKESGAGHVWMSPTQYRNLIMMVKEGIENQNHQNIKYQETKKMFLVLGE